MKDQINKIITDYYLDSNDFNGIQIWNLLNLINKQWRETRTIIQDLINDDVIRVIDEDTDINPNIIRTHFEPIENQLKKIQKDDPGYLCLYPTKTNLKNIVNPDEYKFEPYKLRLALGDAQLSYTSFDLSILEYYRSDPRYKYTNNDIHGEIYYDNDQLSESDKTFIKDFGFSYDKNLNRAVAVFVRYLADISPEHQQVWKAKELSADYKLHPDYFKNTIIGDYGDREPICNALLTEIYIINKMAEAISRPHLFKKDYGEYGEDKPKKFHLLIRPTLEEFNDFMSLFDKIISENINFDFFLSDISREEEVQKDGKIIIIQKGSLRMLDEWIHKYFRPHDWSEWNEAISSLKKIRKLRQPKAHAIKTDIFDQKYFKKQLEMLMKGYRAVRLIRLILANHPKVKLAKIDIPDWLNEGKIWNI